MTSEVHNTYSEETVEIEGISLFINVYFKGKLRNQLGDAVPSVPAVPNSHNCELMQSTASNADDCIDFPLSRVVDQMELRNIFVTVGTTKFDHLIEKINSTDIAEILVNKFKCKKLTVQYGTGQSYDDCWNDLYRTIKLTHFRLKPSLIEHIKESDLIISHAGAGTCLEVLNEYKPLIVVINEQLMDNHQLELAEQLELDGHVKSCVSGTLRETLLNFNADELVRWPESSVDEFIKTLNQLMEIPG